MTLSCTEAIKSLSANETYMTGQTDFRAAFPAWFYRGFDINLKYYDAKFDINVMLETWFHKKMMFCSPPQQATTQPNNRFQSYLKLYNQITCLI